MSQTNIQSRCMVELKLASDFDKKDEKSVLTMWRQNFASLVKHVNSIIHSQIAYNCQLQDLQLIPYPSLHSSLISSSYKSPYPNIRAPTSNFILYHTHNHTPLSIYYPLPPYPYHHLCSPIPYLSYPPYQALIASLTPTCLSVHRLIIQYILSYQ